jgi:lauroyl/myristoyl acyltransferase
MGALFYVLALTMVRTLQALPLRWVAWIGRGGGVLAYWVDARHRRVARQNLAASFPEWSPQAVREHGQRRAVEAIALDMNRAFEAAIRRDPANWFWVHNRWKGRARGPKR